jgi:hypothetical protein
MKILQDKSRQAGRVSYGRGDHFTENALGLCPGQLALQRIDDVPAPASECPLGSRVLSVNTSRQVIDTNDEIVRPRGDNGSDALTRQYRDPVGGGDRPAGSKVAEPADQVRVGM